MEHAHATEHTYVAPFGNILYNLYIYTLYCFHWTIDKHSRCILINLINIFHFMFSCKQSFIETLAVRFVLAAAPVATIGRTRGSTAARYVSNAKIQYEFVLHAHVITTRRSKRSNNAVNFTVITILGSGLSARTRIVSHSFEIVFRDPKFHLNTI